MPFPSNHREKRKAAAPPRNPALRARRSRGTGGPVGPCCRPACSSFGSSAPPKRVARDYVDQIARAQPEVPAPPFRSLLTAQTGRAPSVWRGISSLACRHRRTHLQNRAMPCFPAAPANPPGPADHVAPSPALVIALSAWHGPVRPSAAVACDIRPDAADGAPTAHAGRWISPDSRRADTLGAQPGGVLVAGGERLGPSPFRSPGGEPSETGSRGR